MGVHKKLKTGYNVTNDSQLLLLLAGVRIIWGALAAAACEGTVVSLYEPGLVALSPAQCVHKERACNP